MLFVPKTDVIFVCTENAGRSQMAEAFFQKYAKDLRVSSAGTKPGLKLNPVVVEVMREVGIDLFSKKPKIISDDLLDGSKVKINMGCTDKESYPALFVRGMVNWNMTDPGGRSIDEVRKIRDEIETRVKQLVKNLREN